MAACVFLLATHVHGAFIAPTDNVPFRRDQLPLDVDTMKQLAQHLSLLSSLLDTKEPSSQHTAAQFLALAQALDPIGRPAQDLLERFQKEENPAPPLPADIQLAKSRAWRVQSWLGSDQAGEDGNILGRCLGEVLAKIDPENPSSAAFKSEQARWAGWVAKQSEFHKKPQPNVAGDHSLADGNDPEQMQEEGKSLSDKASFSLKSAVVSTPLMIHREATKSFELRLTPVTMTNVVHQDQSSDQEKSDDQEKHDDQLLSGFRYDLKDVDAERIRPVLTTINKNTLPWLEKTHGELPRGGVVVLSTPHQDSYSIKKNDLNLSAASVVLAHAALSGQEPTGIVIGVVQSDGKLKLPKNGWQMIRSLSEVRPSRIVLPRSAVELLPSLLAMDELTYFMKHDIFLADNIDELVAFSKKTPDAGLAAALNQFAVIREKATPSLGPFVTNPAVRARLETIATTMPQYASVQYLLMQARGKRPSQLSDAVVAHEVRLALAPLTRIAEIYEQEDGKNFVTSAAVQEAHAASRAALDPIDRIVPSTSRDLYGQAVDLSNTARTLARAIKKVAEKNHDQNVKGFHDKSLGESARTLRVGLPAIEQKVSRILGEEEPSTEKKEE